MSAVEWDYTERAAAYDRRAEYSGQALDRLVASIGAGARLAEIGAGTGKLTVQLLRRGFTVDAVEPNDAMRVFGIRNTSGLPVTWRDGTGERTGLPDASYEAALFGSSFNVVDQAATLREVSRILRPKGWFGCMWNHRDLDDALQRRIEALIVRHIPGYDYGKRREDPSQVIVDSSLFGPVQAIEDAFVAHFDRKDFIEAWRSHATLARQADGQFAAIIDEIAAIIPTSPVAVPYVTRIWFAQLT